MTQKGELIVSSCGMVDAVHDQYRLSARLRRQKLRQPHGFGAEFIIGAQVINHRYCDSVVWAVDLPTKLVHEC